MPDLHPLQRNAVLSQFVEMRESDGPCPFKYIGSGFAAPLDERICAQHCPRDTNGYSNAGREFLLPDPVEYPRN
jgi:hypothetical protein